MTRSGLSPRLGQHLPEPFVVVHPDDAADAGVTHGGFAKISTDYGDCVLKVVVDEGQQRGMLFAPIHWSGQTATHARVGALVAPLVDPFSGQPENKATPASIAPVDFRLRGFVLSRTPLDLPANSWWAHVAVTGGYGYLLADNADAAQWVAWMAARGGTNLSDYHDPAQHTYRAATFVNERIDICLFIGPVEAVIDWGSIKAMFAADKLSDDQRRILLSGVSADGVVSAGPTVCACFGVGRTTICDVIAEGARSAVEIGARLKAGTNCGSCIPELKKLIAQAADVMPVTLAAAE